MPSATYFVQECPTCGRRLQIRVEYLGKRVVCHHCRARFEAQDPSSCRYPASEKVEALLRRADELLKEKRGRQQTDRLSIPR